MKRDRTVASGSTIDEGGAMLISPSGVQETGSGTHSPCDATRKLPSDLVSTLLDKTSNPFVYHSDPTKLHQYLSAGKPVVTTPVPAAER
jgi:hypothetical protein